MTRHQQDGMTWIGGHGSESPVTDRAPSLSRATAHDHHHHQSELTALARDTASSMVAGFSFQLPAMKGLRAMTITPWRPAARVLSCR